MAAVKETKWFWDEDNVGEGGGMLTTGQQIPVADTSSKWTELSREVKWLP